MDNLGCVSRKVVIPLVSYESAEDRELGIRGGSVFWVSRASTFFQVLGVCQSVLRGPASKQSLR